MRLCIYIGLAPGNTFSSFNFLFMTIFISSKWADPTCPNLDKANSSLNSKEWESGVVWEHYWNVQIFFLNTFQGCILIVREETIFKSALYTPMYLPSERAKHNESKTTLMIIINDQFVLQGNFFSKFWCGFKNSLQCNSSSMSPQYKLWHLLWKMSVSLFPLWMENLGNRWN